MRSSLSLAAALATATVVMAAHFASAQQSSVSAAYRPGLGDLMTMTVQPRHIKLGLAGQQGNWPYAMYALHELQEAFDRAAAQWPNWHNKFAISDLMAAAVKEPMAAVATAIEAADANAFTQAYNQLTAACNACHQSTERGFIVIQAPVASSFPDQDFRAVKK
jgi:hypothetical protein